MVGVRGGGLAYYTGPSPDGGRGGTCHVNLSDPALWTQANLEATIFHESVPGHHLHVALAGELGLHPVLGELELTSFGEGWALYAERLADEMSLYSGPLQQLGMLTLDSLRAARLVIDTGIHAMGWSRDRAIETLAGCTALTRRALEAEIDRYISDPGQATSYMVGRLELERLRRVAEDRLDDRFALGVPRCRAQQGHRPTAGAGPNRHGVDRIRRARLSPDRLTESPQRTEVRGTIPQHQHAAEAVVPPGPSPELMRVSHRHRRTAAPRPARSSLACIDEGSGDARSFVRAPRRCPHRRIPPSRLPPTAASLASLVRPQPMGGPVVGRVGVGPAEPALCPSVVVVWRLDAFRLTGGVRCGGVRGPSSRSDHRQSGDVRPDDLQGSSVSPVQAGRGPLLLVVAGCGVEGLHRLREGDDGADRQQRPQAGDRRGTTGDLVRSREDPQPHPAQGRVGQVDRRARRCHRGDRVSDQRRWSRASASRSAGATRPAGSSCSAANASACTTTCI